MAVMVRVVMLVRVVVVVLVIVVLLVLLLVLVVVVVIVVEAGNNSWLFSPLGMFSSVHRGSMFSLVPVKNNLMKKILIKSFSFTWQHL